MLAFLIAHQSQELAALAVLVALGRALAPKFAPLAARYPRLAHAAAFVASLAPDVIPAAKALWKIARPSQVAK